MKAFEYYEVQPVIETNGTCTPYSDVQAWQDDVDFLNDTSDGCKAYWSIYGRYDDGSGALLALCIGDFETKDAALDVLNAILAVPARARDTIDADPGSKIAARNASVMLDDMINQSSSRERL